MLVAAAVHQSDSISLGFSYIIAVVATLVFSWPRRHSRRRAQISVGAVIACAWAATGDLLAVGGQSAQALLPRRDAS